MAQAFGIPGRECKVTEFDAAYWAADARGDAIGVVNAWKGYCDCMFIELAEVNDFMSGGTAVIRCINGQCKNLNTGDSLPNTTLESAARDVSSYARQHNAAYSVRIYGNLQPTSDWFKCVSNFCMAPDGCPHPTIPGLTMPFTGPFMPGTGLAPWTDAGAAARHIPKRGAGLFYDVTRFFELDLTAYEPLKLWQTFWRNPPLFGILMAKIQLIPLAGAAYATVMTFTGPPVFLIPGATESCIRQGKDPVKEIWEVAGTGIGEMGKFAVEYLTKCGFGIPGGCGIALIVQKSAQLQIDTGEINNVASAVGKAIIIFMAKSGGQLVDNLFAIANSPEQGFALVFDLLSTTLKTISDALSADPSDAVQADMKKVTGLLSEIFQIAEIIAKGIQTRTSADMIVDNIGDALLGFRPLTYFALLKKDAQAALAMAKSAMEVKATTVQAMVDKAEGIGHAIDLVINAISDFMNKAGIVIKEVDDLLRQLSGIKVTVVDTAAVVVQVGLQIDGVTRHALGIKAGPGAHGFNTTPTNATVAILPGLQTTHTPKATIAQQREAFMTAGQGTLTKGPAKTATPVPGLPPHAGPAPVAQQSSSLAPVLAGAGAGFFIGGPVGAIVGGAALAFLSKK